MWLIIYQLTNKNPKKKKKITQDFCLKRNMVIKYIDNI